MNDIADKCAACGKGGDDGDEALFAKPPPRDECPICMLVLPIEDDHQRYKSCCGKVICRGCIHKEYVVKKVEGDKNIGLCPFCRSPEHTSGEELVERVQRRADADDAVAVCTLGYLYNKGVDGLTQDSGRAIELWLQAAELGDAMAHWHIAGAYLLGQGVGIDKEKAKQWHIAAAYFTGRGMEMDVKKSKHHFEIAAMKGHVTSRHMLGIMEDDAGNDTNAAKHWIVAAEAGCDESLEEIRGCFLKGIVSKEDYAKALRAHQKSKDEMKSEDRAAYSAYENRVGAGEG